MRVVPMSTATHETVEQIGLELLKAGDERASVLLGIALAWRAAPESHFACDIDESAGMAEVVELNKWSTRV